ncbi:MAG TPA: Nudix family hydrolase [Dokdonella sp.]|uniref:Nudix family hydrolase n=1 Tax=Dokdonella sp. TaxID=2291710 RepID=UPI002D7E929E|nr:Nudix family hydrolase [Dokdonella sp.]HET9031928.1 Nudix family hydrolase [Dokdonella sp.]
MTDTNSNRQARTHVVAGVLRDSSGQVLLAQRPTGKEWAGYWEFPGGKVDSTEGAAHALVRELHEELGIIAQVGRGLISVPYADIVLDVHEIASWRGRMQAREGQSLAWVRPANIDVQLLPPADRPVLNALRLPDRYLITPIPASKDDPQFLAALENALRSGVRLVQLRLPGWSRDAVAPLARAVRDCCRAHDAQLLLHADWQLAELLGLDGVHLPARIALGLRDRPIRSERWLAVSCHNAEEIAHAAAIGADFITVSPIEPTPSHAGSAAIGWQRAAALIADAPLPVYVLGGMGPIDIGTAQRGGAQGIAAIRALWPEHQSNR